MAAAEEKISFVLYSSYEEQLNLLSNEQAGELMKAIFVYARTGEKQCQDPMVTMMLGFISYQMDIDARKYAESKERRREAASRAGKISAEKRAMKKAEELQQNATNVNACQRIQHVYVDDDVDEYVDVDENADVDEDADADVDVLDNKTGRRRQEDEEDACAREESNVVDKSADTYTDHIVQPYGKTVLPVLECELEQYQTFANGLMRKYMNRSAKEYDIRQVIHYTGRLAFTPDEKAYVVFDINRAELLEYVFERAAEQERMTWKYIDGIMENYERRDVNSVREAMYNEAQWHAGNIFA